MIGLRQQALLRWLTPVKSLQLFHLFRQGSTLLVAILLPRAGLSPAAIGEYELLLYAAFLLSFAWIAGLVQSLLAQYPQTDDLEKRELFVQAYLITLGLALLISLAFWGLPQAIFQGLARAEPPPYTALFAVFVLGNTPANLQENFYLLQNRPWAIVHYGWVNALLFVLVLCAPPLLGWDFVWSFYGLALLGVLRLTWLTLFVLRHGRWRVQKYLARRWLLPAWPLLLYALLGVVNQSFGSWFIGHYYVGDEAIFAIFRYGAREMPLLIIMTSAFANAVLPLMSEDRRAGLPLIKRKSRRLFHLVFPLSLALMLTSQWWFPWIFSEDFAASVAIFNILLLTTISRVVMTRTILIAYDENHYVVLIALVELIAQALFCLLLAPWLGLAGVALGIVLAFSLEKALMVWLLRYRQGIGLTAYTDVKWLAVYAILMIGTLIFVW